MQFHLGCRNESSQPHNVCDKTALDFFRDLRLNCIAICLNHFDILPSRHLIGLNLGQATAIISTKRLDVNINLVADFHNIACIIRRRNGKIPLRDRNFLFVSDINVCFIAGYLNDYPFDDRTLLDIGHILLFQKFFHALL